MSPFENAADTAQNHRIDKLESTDEKHADRLGAVENAVGAMEVRFDGVERGVDDIKAGTAALGSGFRDDLRGMREAQAAERREEREAASAIAKQKADAAAAWWGSVFKLAGAAVSAAALLAGGSYAAVTGIDRPPPPPPPVADIAAPTVSP